MLNNLLGLIDGHLLNHIRQKLHSLIRRQHLGTHRLTAYTTGFTGRTHAHPTRIQRAFHEFATLGRELLARHLNVRQIRIDLSSNCREQITQLVHLELHF